MITFPKAIDMAKDAGWIHNINFLRQIREELENTGVCSIELDDLDDILVAIEKVYNDKENG